MGAIVKLAGGLVLPVAVGALGFRTVTDGVGNNVQKVTPTLIAIGGMAAFAGAAYLVFKE